MLLTVHCSIFQMIFVSGELQNVDFIITTILMIDSSCHSSNLKMSLENKV